MDDRHRFRAKFAEYVDVAHHVVAQLFFFGGDFVEVDVFEMGAHLFDLGVGDVQPELLFAPGQRQPQPAPGGVFVLGRPDVAHLLPGVAAGQRILVDGVVGIHGNSPKSEVFFGFDAELRLNNSKAQLNY